MKKVRNKFLVLQLDYNLNDIANLFNENQYSEAIGVGILSGTLDNNSVSATFVEKKIVSDQISYPDGETVFQERFEYVYFKFNIIRIRDNFYLFRLINPPLSIKPFVSFLSNLYSNLIVEKYKFNLLVFHDSLKQNSVVENYRVTSLKTSSLPFSDRSAAKLELFSEVDALRELKKVYGDKCYRLDKLVFKVLFEGTEYELSVTSSGAISLPGTLIEETVVESFINALIF